MIRIERNMKLWEIELDDGSGNFLCARVDATLWLCGWAVRRWSYEPTTEEIWSKHKR